MNKNEIIMYVGVCENGTPQLSFSKSDDKTEDSLTYVPVKIVVEDKKGDLKARHILKEIIRHQKNNDNYLEIIKNREIALKQLGEVMRTLSGSDRK